MSGEQPLEKALDGGLESGLTTAYLLDRSPPAMRVSWITWDSGFRGTGLEIGDEILAVDGEVLERPASDDEARRIKPRLIGQWAEGQVWTEKGLEDGAPIALTVRRRRQPGEGWSTHEIQGRLRAERAYYDAEGKRALGPGGPDRFARDDFSPAWKSWYESFCLRDWPRILELGWRQRLNTRKTLESHLEDQPRIDYLLEHYPGPFAAAVAADWEAVRVCLEGRAYEVAPEDLEYRRLGEQRAQEIAAVTAEAWDAYLADHQDELIEPFPGIDPFEDDRSAVTGKLVALPPISPRDWLLDIGRSFLAAGRGSAWYLAASDSEAMRRVFWAMQRYQIQVEPDLEENVELVGRILPEPRLVVTRQGVVAGLEVEPVAARVGEALFVDLGRREEDGRSFFAGEADLLSLGADLPPDDASPRAVLEGMIAALETGGQDTRIFWSASAACSSGPSATRRSRIWPSVTSSNGRSTASTAAMPIACSAT